jgi:HlyD family secretion protein
MRSITILTLALLLTACGEPDPAHYQGYVEGDWLYLSSPQGGYLQTLDVARGMHVEKDAQAYRLNGEQRQQREQDPAALEAQLHAAEAALHLASSQLKRQQQLEKQDFASPSRTDELLTTQVQAAAQVRVLREQLANKLGIVPAAGEVSEIYYRPGEWVPPGQPVLSLLPDARRRILFFVPETAVATLRPGQHIEARCDGCQTPISAHIDFIAAQAEYTPPVIYSQGSREKLVFRIEARPEAADVLRLRPGLPLDISVP